MSFKINSLFSGAGGFDLGFHKAGFETVWANEYDKSISSSFRHNFPDVIFDGRSITSIPNEDIPVHVDGLIGGPPCQSWSEAGARRGIEDQRGQLFFDYIRVLEHIKPKFFVAENVSGIINKRNQDAFDFILECFEEVGYDASWKLLNASDYEVPQDRERVFIVGFRKDLNIHFQFPEPIRPKRNLRDAIGDLEDIPLGDYPNHEITDIGYSPIFMSRNRVRSWDEQSFTIIASDRHIPLHPQAPKMVHVQKDVKAFVEGAEHLYRRMSVRECARVQTFPDTYEFKYKVPRTGYKMIGNAVPVNLAYHLALKIKSYLE